MIYLAKIIDDNKMDEMYYCFTDTEIPSILKDKFVISIKDSEEIKLHLDTENILIIDTENTCSNQFIEGDRIDNNVFDQKRDTLRFLPQKEGEGECKYDIETHGNTPDDGTIIAKGMCGGCIAITFCFREQNFSSWSFYG